MRVTLGHSPDPDDAFMFYGIASGEVDCGGLEFEQVLEDIETLNRRALAGDLDVTAVSIHAYAYLSERYALLPHGASFGDGYGPIVVAKERIGPGDLRGMTIAVPGLLTSAHLALRLYERDIEPRVVRFDAIPAAVLAGEVEAGLLIHEGQLTYAASGLTKVVDLGVWWRETTGLPLPLGGNAVRKDLGGDMMRKLSGILRSSIAYGLEHRAKALTYAEGFGRGLDRALADRFVGMYVNDLTLDYGERGREAVRLFLERGRSAGLIDISPQVEFVPQGN